MKFIIQEREVYVSSRTVEASSFSEAVDLARKGLWSEESVEFSHVMDDYTEILDATTGECLTSSYEEESEESQKRARE